MDLCLSHSLSCSLAASVVVCVGWYVRCTDALVRRMTLLCGWLAVCMCTASSWMLLSYWTPGMGASSFVGGEC